MSVNSKNTNKSNIIRWSNADKNEISTNSNIFCTLLQESKTTGISMDNLCSLLNSLTNNGIISINGFNGNGEPCGECAYIDENNDNKLASKQENNIQQNNMEQYVLNLKTEMECKFEYYQKEIYSLKKEVKYLRKELKKANDILKPEPAPSPPFPIYHNYYDNLHEIYSSKTNYKNNTDCIMDDTNICVHTVSPLPLPNECAYNKADEHEMKIGLSPISTKCMTLSI
mmetsp:Transcript_57180/g.69854  ORF Transcript_57180/g.69854 Transcript_57180/m.69854 type:complete len:227 (-) Transcript_57180:146-826(-)